MKNILPKLMTTVAFVSCATRVFGSLDTELREQADQWHRDEQKASEGVVIAQINGQERHFGTAGRVAAEGEAIGEETVFEIGSITKVFTGVLLSDSVLRGQVDLNDTVADCLPDISLEEDSPFRSITLLELATHTSGLPRLPEDLEQGVDPSDPYAHYSRDRLLAYIQSFKKADLDKPGEYAYSNLGMGLLGELLAIINETSYEVLLEERILAPLKMESTAVQVDRNSIPKHLKTRLATGHFDGIAVSHWHLAAFSGAGAIVSTAGDLLTFAQAHWSSETPEALKKALDFALLKRTETMGLGWHFKANTYMHDGGTGGFRSSLFMNVDSKVARVSLKNSSGQKPSLQAEGDFEPIAGFWSGTLNVGVQKLRLVMHIDEQGNTGMYSIDQGGISIPAAETVFEDGAFSVKFPTIEGRFRAKMEQRELKGEWFQGRGFPLDMVFSENMPGTLVKVFKRTYKGDFSPLAGYWSGTLDDGKQGLFVYLEFAPIGGFYKIRLWSPTQSAFPIAVTQAKFSKGNLSVESAPIGGSFKGLLNLEEKRLVGVWKQNNKQDLELVWSSERPETP